MIKWKRVSKVGLIIALLLLLLCFVLLFLGFWSWKVSYEAGNKTLSNPSRGLYLQINEDDVDVIAEHRHEIRLFLLSFDIYEYRDCDIPEHKLKELVNCLERIREYDAKCIFRAAYGFEPKAVNDADSLERIEAHLEQLAPILNQYSGILLCVQAGFFGPYGEWHSSIYLNKSLGDQAAQNRVWLLKRMTELLDEEIVINVRRPCFIREAEGIIDTRRLGVHNDGLLASDTDLGTYMDPRYTRDEEMEWLSQTLLTGINGGEMPAVNAFSKAERAVSEFRSMQVTYLNCLYNVEVFEDWREDRVGEENALVYIVEHLGYRYDVKEIEAPYRVFDTNLGVQQYFSVTLSNNGFAAIDGRYSAEWVIVTDDMERTVACEADLGAWKGGEELVLSLPVSEVGTLRKATVGLRIVETGAAKKTKNNCVEFATEQIVYDDGINNLFYVNYLGFCTPLRGRMQVE